MSTKKQLKNKRLPIRVILAVILVLLAGKFFLDAAYVPVIIMYHSVGDGGSALDGYGPKLSVTPEAFQKQMDFLKTHNYKVIPLEEFINRIKKGRQIPPRTIAITFDDGLRDNFTNAYPVLKRHEFPATIFVPTDFIGKAKFLTENQIRILEENKITMGSHTLTHAYLPNLGESELKKELVESKKILEAITGKKVEMLSYPLGAFSEKVKKAAKEAGYMGAVATSPGKRFSKDDPYALKRIRISMTGNNLFNFWTETSGYYTFIKERRDAD